MSVTGSHPQVYGANVNRMAKMQGYQRCAAADNIAVFHGREIRQVMWGKTSPQHVKRIQPLACSVALPKDASNTSNTRNCVGCICSRRHGLCAAFVPGQCSRHRGLDTAGSGRVRWLGPRLLPAMAQGPSAPKRKCHSGCFYSTALTLAQEGFTHFATKFGPEAYVCHNTTARSCFANCTSCCNDCL